MLVPGTLWKQYHIEVGKLMTSELLGLGLLDKADVQNETQKACIQKYFMHGTSHHMGLDTHDYGILTEPNQYMFHSRTGIYIPAEGFGIRRRRPRDSRKRRTIQPNAQHSY
jgi:Xaa-Pro aminopeptidase